MSRTRRLSRDADADDDDDDKCDCDNKYGKSSKHKSRREGRSSVVDEDPVVMPDFDAIMDEIKHKKCAVVELVRQQIDRFHDGDEDFMNELDARRYARSAMMADMGDFGLDEKEEFRKKVIMYLTYGLAALLLFGLLYALSSACCSGGSKGKRCWLFISNLFSCRTRHPGSLHSTF